MLHARGPAAALTAHSPTPLLPTRAPCPHAPAHNTHQQAPGSSSPAAAQRRRERGLHASPLLARALVEQQQQQQQQHTAVEQNGGGSSSRSSSSSSTQQHTAAAATPQPPASLYGCSISRISPASDIQPDAQLPFILVLPDLDGGSSISRNTARWAGAGAEVHALQLTQEFAGGFDDLCGYVEVSGALRLLIWHGFSS